MNLNQVTVPSIDLNIAVPFYQLLGLRLIVDALPNYARFECPDGEATFSIHQRDEIGYGYGVTVYFELENLDQKVEALQGKGMTFDLLPTDQLWLWREARLKDPDGNRIILYHAGDNRKFPPWRIG
jgi:catechol 2,3-dioxygenase-like lactoylglutathione lyase family enzyme